MKVALCSGHNQQEVTKYLQEEAKSAEIEVEHWAEDAGDISSVHAVVCLAESGEGREPRLLETAQQAVSVGKPVIWAVEGEQDFSVAFKSFINFAAIGGSVVPILEAILSLPRESEESSQKLSFSKFRFGGGFKKEEPVEEEEVAETPDFSGSPVADDVPNYTESATKPDGYSSTDYLQTENPQSAFSTLTNVIAIGGPSGCGSSFIAWNLASLLQAILIEGRTTGALAAWLKGEDRMAVLEGRSQSRYGVVANMPISQPELQILAKMEQLVVVDTGEAKGEIWRLAKTRLYVVTPDPQYVNHPIPPNAKLVVNRYSEQFPAPADKIFHHPVDLVVMDLGYEALKSLWSKVPWVIGQSESEQNKWRKKELVSAWSSARSSW